MVRKIIIACAAFYLCGFTYGYKDNPQTGKKDLVTTGITIPDVSGLVNATPTADGLMSKGDKNKQLLQASAYYTASYYSKNPIIYIPGVTTRDPSQIVKIGSTYHVYVTYDTAGTYWNRPTIAHFSAPTALGPWTLGNPVVIDHGAVGTWDAFCPYVPEVYVEGSTIYLFYSGMKESMIGAGDFAAQISIGVATTSITTPDGPFIKSTSNPLMVPSNTANNWREKKVLGGPIIKTPAGQYRMYCKGTMWADSPTNSIETRRTGYYYCNASEFPNTWHEYAANPIFGQGIGGHPANKQLEDPGVIYLDGIYYQFFSEGNYPSIDGNTEDMVWYKSTDGISNWVYAPEMPNIYFNADLQGTANSVAAASYTAGFLDGDLSYLLLSGYDATSTTFHTQLWSINRAGTKDPLATNPTVIQAIDYTKAATLPVTQFGTTQAKNATDFVHEALNPLQGSAITDSIGYNGASLTLVRNSTETVVANQPAQLIIKNNDTTANNTAMIAFSSTLSDGITVLPFSARLQAIFTNRTATTAAADFLISLPNNGPTAEAFKVKANGDGSVTGDFTAAKYHGDGSLLTNLPSITLPIVTPTGTGLVTLPAPNTSYTQAAGQTGYVLPTAAQGGRVIIDTAYGTPATVQTPVGQALSINGSLLYINSGQKYSMGAYESAIFTYKDQGIGLWVCDAKDKYVAGGGSVTSVTSANTDISVATATTTPVLTLNSGWGANQIPKLDASAYFGNAGTLIAPLHFTSTILTGLIERTTTGTNTPIASFGVRAKSSVNVSDGFGAGINFLFGDDTLASQALGQIGAVRDGSDTLGALYFSTYNNSAFAERLRVTSNGHTEYSGATPAVVTCGTSPSAVGNDNTGTITVGSGVVMACTLNFVANANCTAAGAPFACCTGSGTGTCGTGWTNNPNCFVTGNSLITLDVTAKSTTSITFGASATVAGGTLDYFCVGRR